MRHLKRTAKLGRTGTHRNAMLANLVCSLIIHKRVQTTVAKAKAARSVAEKMVTLGKGGTISDRRLAVARLHNEQAAKILFTELAPVFKDRPGGYTRIIRMNERQGDAAQLAILEFVDSAVEAAPAPEGKKTEDTKADGNEAGGKKTKKAKKAADPKS
ncbi:MAG: 50S ribosomal protein L17 [Planctomycetaceae bacterium]|nr:50S ribosomal protein L17 [Planctomycetaceae bacterium]